MQQECPLFTVLEVEGEEEKQSFTSRQTGAAAKGVGLLASETPGLGEPLCL